MSLLLQEKEARIEAEGPFYLPFYNEWSKNIYWQDRPFHINPFSIRALSTSGSPVLLSKNKFIGFMKDTDGEFIYEGNGRLWVSAGENQKIYIEEDCDPWEAWERYNQEILRETEKNQRQEFWQRLEYCTWVEQKRQALEQKKRPQDVLSEDFVYNYLKRVNRLGLPKGKFTIDDGWAVGVDQNGNSVFGDWEIDQTKFKNFSALISDIKNEGFVPGLWFAPGWITRHAKIAALHPHWIGIPFQGVFEVAELKDKNYFSPLNEIIPHYRKVFLPFIQMGIRKFKFDMYYEDKRLMKQLIKLVYDTIKAMDPTVEIEVHIPDIFVSRYADTVRTNDVLIEPATEWRSLTYEHYRVCRYSSPDKVINLDHIGGNSPKVSEENFMEHWNMLKEYEGYPVVSLLPDHFSLRSTDRFRREMNEKY